jgi:hypothetical protein
MKRTPVGGTGVLGVDDRAGGIAIDRLVPSKHRRDRSVQILVHDIHKLGMPEPALWHGKHGAAELLDRGLSRGSLGGEAVGSEPLVRDGVRDIRRRRGSFFLDLGEQPGLGRGGRPLSLRIVIGEVAGLENDRAQLGNAAAAPVVEMNKRKLAPLSPRPRPPGHPPASAARSISSTART